MPEAAATVSVPGESLTLYTFTEKEETRQQPLVAQGVCPGQPSPSLAALLSPVLHLLAQVVKALAQLVHLGLLAFQVGAVLLEAAGQRA